MISKIRLVFAFLVFCLLPMALPIEAQEEEAQLNWTLRNEHEHVIYIRFFSQDREVEWPGNGLTYPFDDNLNHTQALICKPGENICFGGFNGDRTKSWGIGEYGQGSCTSCCRYCGGNYPNVDILK